MLTNLITAIGIATSIGMTPPHQPPLRSGVTNYNIEYEYETNEVNSIDDLVIGNIYHLINEITTNNTTDRLTDYLEDDNLTLYNTKIYNPKIDESYIQDMYIDDSDTNNIQDYGQITGNTLAKWQMLAQTETEDENYLAFVVLEFNNNSWFLGAEITYTEQVQPVIEQIYEETNKIFLEKSNYLGTTTITEVTTEGIYNSIETFIETYLYGNDKLRETEYTIMGTTYNMAEWLAHTTTIVLISLIIIVLVMFIKWLFKQIGNTFNLVGVLQ